MKSNFECLKCQLKYDKLNTKYNRIWEQCTSIILFIFGSIVAYSIAYLEYSENRGFIIFLSKIIIPVTLILIPILLMLGALLALLFITGQQVRNNLKENKVII